MSFDNLPEDLRRLPQWLLWRSVRETPDVKPTKLPISVHTGNLASVTNPSTWATFEAACNMAQHATGIGFVLTQESGLTCIDLDHTDNPEEQARQVAIFNAFDSYAEVSPSGKGLHIWVKGTVPSGRRRACVEVYSTERYMTCTGAIYNNKPIVERQELLTQLWEEMEGINKITSSVDKPETQDDYSILKAASQAANGQKFIDLYEGRWNDYYPSQSEADFALVDILAFYTQNRAQIMRIFRASELGKRDKAKRDKYIIYMLNRCFDRMLPEIDMDGLRNQVEEQLAVKATIVKEQQLSEAPTVNEVTTVKQDSKAKTVKPSLIGSKHLSVPPGLVGEIARFIHDAAPRPVPEIAIAGAIGLMTGVCGRSYNVSGTGLNQYMLLLGATGSGKEAIASGIDKLMNVVQRTVPAANEFIGPSEIASPQALIKYMGKTSKSFVSIVGEFGLMLKQISSFNANPNQVGLRRTMLDLYNKSGQGKQLGRMIYSEKEKNTEVTSAPSFSIMGESTPEKFYEILSKDMIEEGLLPRFCIIEYHGKRPQLNVSHNEVVPSMQLSDYFSALCAYSLQLNNGNNAIDVQLDSEAQAMFDSYNDYCDKQINSGNEVTRQLWNRAHIKALKLAALLAVGCNYIAPVINAECATWSLHLITNDVGNILARFETGEIGIASVQNDQTLEIRKAIKKYLVNDWSEIAKYPGATLQTHSIKVIPHSFISSFCRNRASFKNDRLGPIPALKTALQSLIDCDEIRELSPQDKRLKSLAGNARLYMVSGMALV